LLVVEDRGPGIPADVQSKLFERFSRGALVVEFSGLGLGLYVVRAVARAHGGNVDIDSRPGQGTRVIVNLPLRASPEATLGQPEAQSNPDGGAA
jgi:two-component system OmpR family sensor kinase